MIIGSGFPSGRRLHYVKKEKMMFWLLLIIFIMASVLKTKVGLLIFKGKDYEGFKGLREG
ncbi:hypothetical protein ACVGW4_00090 [Enterobacter hormaechei]